MSDNPFALTERVCIELSNRCNYAYAHKRCPVHHMRGHAPVILPGEVVRHVLESLGKHRFAGVLSFHLYNEPTVDPRLFDFIDYAGRVCPGACVDICTNGSYIDAGMVNEFADVGTCSLRVSGYSNREYDRLSAYSHPTMYYRAHRAHLDSQVLKFYTPPEPGDVTRNAAPNAPCRAPLMELNVTRDGDVGLCFLDWKHQHTWGDLHKETLAEIVQSDPVQETARRLRKGDRFLALCKTCGRARTKGCVQRPPQGATKGLI